MGVEETALELIDLIYDAALAPEKWRAFMGRFAAELGSHSALLRENDCTGGNVGLFETVGYDPAYVAAYREHFVHLDHFTPVLAKLPIGSFVRGDAVVPWEQQRNSEFYNDYMRALKNRHVMGGILARNDRYQLMFALQRELGQPDFNENDMRLVHLVMPHMARAVRIHRQLAEVTAEKQWALSALDRLRVGVILLDDKGRPLFFNRAAEYLASGGTGFVAGRDGLSLPSATETARLRRLIADAAKSAAGQQGCATAGCLHTVGRNGGRLQFQVIPLHRGLSEQPWGESLPGGCVAVFISSSGGPRLSWNRMMAMHGFTRAEAKLASLLADGINLEGAAEALSISVHTARSQLKTVFAKAGVSRQAELIALLLADMLTNHADNPVESFQ